MGRPAKHNKRDIVNAVLHVAATGCQWRSLPDSYPNWSTVHNYHLEWSRNGTWERVADRLRVLVRVQAGHDPHPSASIIDARTVRGASTVTSATRGYDAGKKISGRKTFGLVDTLGLLIAVVVVAASTSDNAGGIEVLNPGNERRPDSQNCGVTPGSRRHSWNTAAVVTSTPKLSQRSIPASSWSNRNVGSSNEPGHGS